MIHIVIPFEPSPWQDNELRYHLRSLEKNLKSDFDVTILSSGSLPDWIKGVKAICVDRFYPDGLADRKYSGYKHFENFFDTANKLFVYAHRDSCPSKFVWAYDDQLLLQPIKDFSVFDGLAVSSEKADKLRKYAVSRHTKTILEAINIVRRRRRRNGVCNAETHAYKPFTKENLLNLFKFDDPLLRDIPYAVNTVYRNLFCEIDNVVKDTDAKIIAYAHWDDSTQHHYLPTTNQELDLISQYIMLSYNDAGLNAVGGILRKWIESMFPEKSKFEV